MSKSRWAAISWWFTQHHRSVGYCAAAMAGASLMDLLLGRVAGGALLGLGALSLGTCAWIHERIALAQAHAWFHTAFVVRQTLGEAMDRQARKRAAERPN